MEIEVRVSEKVADTLLEISRLHDCSVEMAVNTVLERYAERTQHQIEAAQKVGNKVE